MELTISDKIKHSTAPTSLSNLGEWGRHQWRDGLQSFDGPLDTVAI
jgi:hypothetical protein